MYQNTIFFKYKNILVVSYFTLSLLVFLFLKYQHEKVGVSEKDPPVSTWYSNNSRDNANAQNKSVGNNNNETNYQPSSNDPIK